MTGIIELALLILFGATIAVAFSSRLRLPIEVLLVVGSLLLSLVPGLAPIKLKPELVFLFFLPPILFQAAYFTSWRDFKANRRPILLLAIGLVLFTTVSVAAVLKLLIPSIPWPVGFILGAMVSPPDASAATAITRKLGVPRRLVTIIEGESLVNDATALVAYRFALAALATGTFSLTESALQFVWVGVGGVAVGLATGWVGMWLVRRLSSDVRAQILVSIITAFGAYIFGEVARVSGVIATVTAGLFFGRCLPVTTSAETRIEGKANWDFLVFVINAFVFTIIGLQLPEAISNLSGYTNRQLVLYATVVSLAVVAVRFAWVFAAAYLPRLLFPSIAAKDPAPTWRTLTVLGWTAMRGIVSLAAALALPNHLPNGAPFPERNLLIFLTYTVILVTLIVPSVTLPWLLRELGLHAGSENQREEIKARIASTRAALASLTEKFDERRYTGVHIEQMRRRYERRLEVLSANSELQAFSPLDVDDQQRRRLLSDLIRRERAELELQRKAGSIHDEVFHSLAHELDLEELRLHSQRI